MKQSVEYNFLGLLTVDVCLATGDLGIRVGFIGVLFAFTLALTIVNHSYLFPPRVSSIPCSSQLSTPHRQLVG